ncbi:hypothetical protein J2X45_003898 [Caulobacter sp. BE264]|uniref:hypothetical protein n=1 Tax=Caulobacter sp. BE264 TaxID=2817724 RepID=UPI002865DA67|nr:hypothetical protein [Caulobacter sp. BE264]MDR7232788.1 hypothetical protein [Caulobacter sp. BE264]
MSDIGFHVWNPAGRLPTYTHPTFLAAWAEKDRLQALHPDQRFVVMMPCENMSGIGYGLGFTAGRKEAQDDAVRLIDRAQQRAEQKTAEAAELRRDLKALRPFLEDVEAYQSIVADCLLWIQGFNAAYAGRESYERPDTPSVERLRDLNAALQRLMRDHSAANGRPALDDSEIPF